MFVSLLRHSGFFHFVLGKSFVVFLVEIDHLSLVDFFALQNFSKKQVFPNELPS